MNFLNNLSTVLNQSLNDEPTYKNVIDEKNNNQVSIVTYNKNTVPMDSCCITMNNFEEGEKIAKLPCNHYFNKEAIMEWLTTEKAECPICRFKLKSIEIKHTNQEEKMPETVLIRQTDLSGNTIINSEHIDVNNLFNDLNTNDEFVQLLINFLSSRRQNNMRRELSQLQQNIVNNDADFQQAILNSLTQ